MQRKLRLLTFLIIQISLRTISVSSSKCGNLKNGAVCIELCCDVEQFYAEANRECVQIKDDIGAWYDLQEEMTSTQKINFVSYDRCPKSNDTWTLPQTVIASCHSPHYDKDAKRYTLKEHFDVPCKRFAWRPKGHTELAALLVPALLLPVMLLYTCTRKDKKDNLSFKLVTWYLTSTIATILTVVLRLYMDYREYAQGSLRLCLFILAELFYISTFLWLNCIGCNVYIQYKEANEPNTKHKDQKRFIWFSIYVWLTALTIVVISRFILRSAMVTEGPGYLIAYFNVLAFLVLSVKICEIRCRIAQLTSEKHLKCHLLLKILRLSLLMGIPRMLLVISHPLSSPYIYVAIIYVCIMFLEPYVVFMAFIADHVNFRLVLLCRCCHPGNQDLERTTSTETNHANVYI